MPPKDNQSGDSEKSGSAHLDKEQQEQAEEFASPRALVIHEIIRQDGEQELLRTPGALCFSGVAAGLSMGFSFLTLALLRASLPDTPWRHDIESLGYSVGFIFVILGRQQLFTESTLTAVLPVLTNRDFTTLLKAAQLWIIVLSVNLIGTWLFAAILLVPGIFPPEVNEALREFSITPLSGTWLVTFIKSAFAGWLIALMVWILPSARSARLLTVIIVTYVVALAQLSHIVAGSTEAAFAVMSNLASFGDYFLKFLVPTLLGNTVGGVALVSMLNHGSILPEMAGQSGEQNKGGSGRKSSGRPRRRHP